MYSSVFWKQIASDVFRNIYIIYMYMCDLSNIFPEYIWLNEQYDHEMEADWAMLGIRKGTNFL